MTDFSVEANDVISVFSETYDPRRLVKKLTWYKDPNRLSCIDIIFVNIPQSFQQLYLIEIGFIYLHKMTHCTKNEVFHYGFPQ